MNSSLFLIIFLICASIQTVYFLIFLIAFTRYKPGNISGSLPVSVVISAHDEEENLKKLLPALYAQDHPDFEIIVVEDRSNDNTYDLLLKETREQPKLRMVKVDHTPDNFNGKKYGLTLGIKAAKHDLILLTDADCVPNDDQWISTMAAAFDDKTELNLGFSYYKKEKGFLNTFIRFETLWTAIQYLGLALAGRPYMGVGRNLAYRKSLFIRKKGFNPHLGVTGGDDDLFVNQHAQKSNTTVTIGSHATVYSWPKTTVREFFRQKVRHLSVGKFYSTPDKIMLGLFTFTHVLFWIMLPFLMIFHVELYVLGGSFLIRMLLSYLTFFVACKKLNVKFGWWSLIFLEFIFVFYYVLTGTTAVFTKRVRWS